METYRNLMNAVKILEDARYKITMSEGMFSPAWDFINHAVTKLREQAETAFRGL